MPTIKNILIFGAIGGMLILGYVLFLKPDPEPEALISSTSNPSVQNATSTAPGTPVAEDFLSVLLNVKSIKLNDAIFSDNAFLSLKDSSITLIPDGNEGRPNPFAPIGIDVGLVVPSIDTLSVPATTPTTLPPTDPVPPTVPNTPTTPVTP